MVSAVSSATVPQFCVIVRKAYGAGLYAMGGPGFAPDATIALPTARIAVMGPEAAVNAVYANKIAAIEDDAEREQFVQDRRREYETDVDLERLAADLVLDQIIEADDLRAELLLGSGTQPSASVTSPPSAATSRRSDRRAQTGVRGAKTVPGEPDLGQQLAQQGQAEPDDVAGVPLDAGDERAAQPVEGEGAGHPQRLAGPDVVLDLGVVSRAKCTVVDAVAPSAWRRSRRSRHHACR